MRRSEKVEMKRLCEKAASIFHITNFAVVKVKSLPP